MLTPSYLCAPGRNVYKWLSDMIRCHYPQVRLLWLKEINRWGLLTQDFNGPWTIIKIIDDGAGGYVHPNMENTIRWLVSHDVRRKIQNAEDKRLWLQEIDKPPPEKEDLIAEGHKELLSVMRQRAFVQQYGNTPDSQVPSSSGSDAGC